MTIEDLMNRFDDAVNALERIADALEALEVLGRIKVDLNALEKK